MAGYNWRAGKSNNAVAAETQGLVVKSKITADWLKAHGIKEKVSFIKFLIRGGIIVAEEWHHTSKFFNRTDYYSAEVITETLEMMEEEGRLQVRLSHAYAGGLSARSPPVDLRCYQRCSTGVSFYALLNGDTPGVYLVTKAPLHGHY